VSFLIDTNVLSELRKGARADTGVRDWIESVDEAQLFLSVLVVGELRQGVERIRRRDPRSAARLHRWLEQLSELHAERILGVDLEIAYLWGWLNVPDPLPVVDALLAATAIVHDLTLVTRNTRDVAKTGVRVLNPFNAGAS
jgi:predicted nucleic acid-binding protein